jgi:hypothetical protein
LFDTSNVGKTNGGNVTIGAGVAVAGEGVFIETPFVLPPQELQHLFAGVSEELEQEELDVEHDEPEQMQLGQLTGGMSCVFKI